MKHEKPKARMKTIGASLTKADGYRAEMRTSDDIWLPGMHPIVGLILGSPAAQIDGSEPPPTRKIPTKVNPAARAV